MKKALYVIALTILLSSCATISQPSANSGSTEETPSSTTSGSVDEGEKLSFTPEVGEVRQWFSAAKDGSEDFYNYCPSIFVENNVKHIYYCTNKLARNVTDYIGYRTGTFNNDNFDYSDTQFVLEHGETGQWDSRHVCDPSVVKGEFKYNDETYSYLMAYLGCLTSDTTNNEIGIAVSKSAEGPWLKVSEANPLVPYSELASSAWGTGQPSLLSVDKKGTVIMCYTAGETTRTYSRVIKYDMSNLNDIKKLKEKDISTFGTSDSFINNADFAYDPTYKRILMVKGITPFGSDGKYPNFVEDKLEVYAMDDSSSEEKFDEIFLGNNSNRWSRLGTINKLTTGFDRNHNPGFVTNEYGETIETDRIEVAFSKSDTFDTWNDWNWLSTYRIYSTAIKLTYVK